MKKSKIIFCLISFLSVSFYAQAQFSGTGAGTENDPYQITTASQLNEMHNYEGAAGNGVHFRLMNDIDLAAFITQEYPGNGWDPVGSDTDAASFNGFLHGGDFTITNIWINRGSTDYVGLFGYIKNGGVDHLNVVTDAVNGITGSNNTGILAGGAEASTITYSDATGKVNGASNVGGLIGTVNQDAVIQFNTATTVTVIVADGSNVGGLIGQSASPVSDCTASGTVSVAGDSTGGLIGTITAPLSNSSASVDITNTGTIFVGNFMGGLVGTQQATVTNCFATGSVHGTNVVGGLVGNSFAPVSDSHATGQVIGNVYVGGLVGGSDAVTNSYATGDVVGDQDYIGGLVGQAYGTIGSCYATGDVSGAKTIGGLVGSAGMPVSHSYASGNVTQTIPVNIPEGGFLDVGGLIGNAGGTVTNCYATGNVHGVLNSMYVGGLIGLAVGEVNYCYASGSVITESFSLIGGLVGDAWATVSNSVAANPVVIGLATGEQDLMHRVAGLTEFDAVIVNCYALESTLLNGNLVTTGQLDNLDGFSKTIAFLQGQAGYDNDLQWDFADIWTIREGHGYPYFGNMEYLSSIVSASVNNSDYGTISPIGDVAVQDGSDLSVTITPAEGYVIESVMVDGVNVGVQATYAFSDIAANHTIEAVFAQDLGVDDHEAVRVTAWPNPVANVLNLSSEANITSVELYNLFGQKVMAREADENQLQLNMSGLATGTYLLKVNSGNKLKTLKIIKQ